jgi:nitrogenase-associated protein
MAKVTFWEKPGCANNTRQKGLLAASGHEVEARSLLAEPWEAERLRSFFGNRPVAEWFNNASPRVKSGEVVPAAFAADAAIAAMLADPLLIRRPLMESGDRREVGFDTDLVDAWLGLARPDAPRVGSLPQGRHDARPLPRTDDGMKAAHGPTRARTADKERKTFHRRARARPGHP